MMPDYLCMEPSEVVIELGSRITTVWALSGVPGLFQCFKLSVEVIDTGCIHQAFYVNISLDSSENITQKLVSHHLGNTQVTKFLLQISFKVKETT